MLNLLICKCPAVLLLFYNSLQNCELFNLEQDQESGKKYNIIISIYEINNMSSVQETARDGYLRMHSNHSKLGVTSNKDSS